MKILSAALERYNANTRTRMLATALSGRFLLRLVPTTMKCPES